MTLMLPRMAEIHSISRLTRELLISPEDCPALRDVGIRLAGISDAARGFSFVRHRPDFFQILACLGGEGEVWVDHQWRACRTGDVYLTPSGVFHAYRAIRRHRWKLAWVAFHVPATVPLVQPELARKDVFGLAAAIEELHRESVGLRSPVLTRQLVDVLSFHRHRLLDRGAGDDRLLKLWSKVHALLERKWSLDRLAEEAHVSTEHLRRLCHVHYGRSPQALLRDMRMRRAATLIQRSPVSVEQVAGEVGYADPFSFSKAFKRFFGVNPSRHRGSVAGNSDHYFFNPRPSK